MMSASHHLASASCSTVLPVPNPPGSAARLPRPTGKSVSRMRCPVIIGPAIGEPLAHRARLAHRPGVRERDLAASRRPHARAGRSVSSSEYSPAGAIQRTMPAAASGGIRHSCGRGVATLPIGWPGCTRAPGVDRGLEAEASRRPASGAGLDEGSVRGIEGPQQAVADRAENAGTRAERRAADRCLSPNRPA